MVTVNNSLINRLLQRDEEAFKTIFYIYRSRIFYIAYKLTRNRFDAEDCVQDIFVKVLDNLYNYNQKTHTFTSWIITLAKNHVLDYIKLKKIHEGKCFIDSDLVDCSYVDNKFENAVLLSEVEKLVGELNYQILLFKIGFGMTFIEIARLLEMSPSKAKRLYYATYDVAKAYVRERGNDEEEVKEISTKRS